MGTGRGDCVVIRVERKTSLVLIGKLANRTAGSLSWLISHSSGYVETVIADNGTECHDYEGIERRTGQIFYLARSYHSLERGSSEDTNGLIHRYLPKEASIAALSQQQCNAIARKLNTRPWKRLGFRTPPECFINLSQCCGSELKSGNAPATVGLILRSP